MRSLSLPIEKDLPQKFILLTGPRQVGKTHLAQSLLTKLGGKYYNWDLAEDRHRILEKGFLNDKTVVLDELHKYDRWKVFLKGIYDKFHDHLHVLVTGSARLDVYRRGGDSLFGRHFLYHLHPLTMGEVSFPEKISRPELILGETNEISDASLLTHLMKWGGFPEPFYAANDEAHKRWSLQRLELLVRQDIHDLTNISLLSLVEHLILLLPDRVGSVLSINSLKEDLRIAYNTVLSWLKTLESLYIVFILNSFTTKMGRAVHKEKKLYLWDWSQVKDEGNRFENLVACHLLKAVQIWRDLGMGDFGLFFLRDRDRREVDFCITLDHKPWLLVEAKLSDTQIAGPLVSFTNRFQVPGVQVVLAKNVNKKQGLVSVISADRWLLGLP